MNPLVARPDGPLRRVVRRAVPFDLRVGVRRAPHIVRWLRNPPEVTRGPGGRHVVCERSTPLRRPNTTYTSALQAAKEANVRRVAAALDGIVVEPGARLSWHAVVGPPLGVRGFARGPELHDGRLARGAGGGACQVANLLFWLGAHAGLTLVERHRHGLDLFPDHQRTVPFGCGATVFYPHRDLVFDNPHPTRVHFAFAVDRARVHGVVTTDHPLPARWSLVETRHRFFRRDGAVWRANTLVRRRTGPHGSVDTPLVDNLARVVYPVAPALLES
jgi:vancomycin resistance protein VanW